MVEWMLSCFAFKMSVFTLCEQNRSISIFIQKQLDENGDILQKNLVLDYDDYPGWFQVNTNFSGLDDGIYKIGIGRRDAWAYDYQLTVEWAELEIEIS